MRSLSRIILEIWKIQLIKDDENSASRGESNIYGLLIIYRLVKILVLEFNTQFSMRFRAGRDEIQIGEEDVKQK